MARTTSLCDLKIDVLPTIITSVVDRVTEAEARYTSSRVTAAECPGLANQLVGDGSQAGLSTPNLWEKQQLLRMAGGRLKGGDSAQWNGPVMWAHRAKPSMWLIGQ